MKFPFNDLRAKGKLRSKLGKLQRLRAKADTALVALLVHPGTTPEMREEALAKASESRALMDTLIAQVKDDIRESSL
jgi:hypothetical protein